MQLLMLGRTARRQGRISLERRRRASLRTSSAARQVAAPANSHRTKVDPLFHTTRTETNPMIGAHFIVVAFGLCHPHSAPIFPKDEVAPAIRHYF